MIPRLNWVNLAVWGGMTVGSITFWGYLGCRAVSHIMVGLPR